MLPTLVIVNPAARGGRTAEAEAVAALLALGCAPTIVRTQAPGHAARLAREAPDSAVIYVLGGDGTVMEVAGARVGRATPIGILPGGTGNQLARHFGIPLRVGRALRALAAGTARPFDLGRLEDGRHFAIAAGLGMDAAMIAGTSPAAKRRLGVAAYVLSAARAALQVRPFPLRITVDGVSQEREASLAMIANVGAIMNGRLRLGPDARPDDGLLDVCVLSPDGAADALLLASWMLRGVFRPDPRLWYARGRRIRLEAPAGVPAEADGELLQRPILSAEAIADGARFLVPIP